MTETVEFSLANFRKARAQFQEDAQVLLSHAAVSIRIDFQTPAQAINVQRRRVNRIAFLLKLCEVFHEKNTCVVCRNYFRDKISWYWCARIA